MTELFWIEVLHHGSWKRHRGRAYRLQANLEVSRLRAIGWSVRVTYRGEVLDE